MQCEYDLSTEGSFTRTCQNETQRTVNIKMKTKGDLVFCDRA
jgi:hypothetical protein